MPPGPVLFYDGTCGLCTRSVRWVLRHEAADGADVPLFFASLDGPHGRDLIDRNPELALVDSVLWAEADGRVLIRSAAVLAVLRYVGGAWGWLAGVLGWVPAPVLDLGYRVVARFRRVIPGMRTPCTLPSPAQRSRMLD